LPGPPLPAPGRINLKARLEPAPAPPESRRIVILNAPGEGVSLVLARFVTTLYGFAEFDSITDTTQSLGDVPGNALIARPGSYQGDHFRGTFGIRNSRLGLRIDTPRWRNLLATTVFEMDFLGNPAPGASESVIFASPVLRVRHLYLKVNAPMVDVLVGQYWQLFGWQPYHGPATVQIQGVPGQVYSRSPQVRISHVFPTEPISVEVAIAAARQPQRDGLIPDGQGGVRLLLPGWRGLRTIGATGTVVDAADLGVSGTVRRFSVPELSATPAKNYPTVGWGVSVDTMIPILRAKSGLHGNYLTFTGSFVRGQGISDLFTQLTGGVGFPSLPNPTNASPAPMYNPGIDTGLVGFDKNGRVGTIGWQAYLLGLQYYFPPAARVFIAANFSETRSYDILNYGDPKKLYDLARWVDACLFVIPIPAIRLGVEYAYTQQHYGDGVMAPHHRAQLSAFYLF
jgi:hypothetical protein